MTLALIAILAFATVIGSVRIVAWQRAATVRAPGWRIAVLLALQAACAISLYLTLRPTGARGAADTMIVATRNAPGLGAADRLVVALPEAPPIAGAERVPDLATALRRYPGARALRIVGEGLEPRDRNVPGGVAVAFDPAALPRGLVALGVPSRVAAGGAFLVGGSANGLAGGSAELLDPSGARVAQQPIARDGRFVLAGTARGAGFAPFVLRLHDAGRSLVSEETLPIRVVADAAPRMLLIGGAPGPELKYLRRWASDAGYAVQAQFAAGGGVTLGDAPVALTPATLARFDWVVLDERSWAAAGGGGRAALIAAVRGGLGLLLRATGPVPDATRGQWRALGLSVSAGSEAKPVRLADGVVVTRQDSAIGGADIVPLLRAADGTLLTAWRARGRGRIAVTNVLDSFALTLAGQDARYDALWRAVAETLARAQPGAEADVAALPAAGQRTIACGLAPDARVTDPDGTAHLLRIDRGAERCAGFWPIRAGWHVLRHGARRQPFFVWSAEALRGVRALERREAALRLISGAVPGDGAIRRARDSGWVWPIAFLVCAGVLWWFERRRAKR